MKCKILQKGIKSLLKKYEAQNKKQTMPVEITPKPREQVLPARTQFNKSNPQEIKLPHSNEVLTKFKTKKLKYLYTRKNHHKR